ncbi:MAG: hypothetical protein K940chlam5_00026 [Candidatus Anoxychlamydiales bacterium]|nr:hypothetical protein [Candidatus Anoxychlamydiales bacterium]
MRYHFKMHKEGKSFWAECLELKGCITQGNSKAELLENMQEALNLYLEEPENSSYLAPLPKKIKKTTASIIEVHVDPEIAFSFLVRYYRIKNNMTQAELAKELGFKRIYSYQRLERKCNPTLETIFMIKSFFPEFSIDYALS